MAGVLINGNEYDIPTLSSLSMDEYQILYDLSGLTVVDFVDDEKSSENYWNPGYQRALIAAAIMRARPEVKRAEAVELAGKVTLLSVIEREVDAGPPDEKSKSDTPDSEDGSQSSSDPSGASS